MANRKKEVYKPKPITEGKRNIIQGLLQEYDIETADDIQDALKDLLSGKLKEMMETEMDEHLAMTVMSAPMSRITGTERSRSVSVTVNRGATQLGDSSLILKWQSTRQAICCPYGRCLAI